jgi:beta-lactamase regulating signal transducer with metallopeptidase domain
MVLENILSEEIIQKLGWTLLHFVWQAAVVAMLLGILLAMLRKSSANIRYIIACAALGLIVLLPIITVQMIHVSTPQPITNIKMLPAPTIVQTQPAYEEIPPTVIVRHEEPTQFESADAVPNIPWRQRAIGWLEPALPYLVTGWLLGVFGLSLWHLGGWTQLQRLKKRMVKHVDAPLRAKLNELSGRLQVKRAVQLMESALVQVPTVVGWLSPVILLPASALTGLTAEQLEALLAHELAHIRRYDYLVNMLQTVVETLGFYHPAVWWVSHTIRTERENCCDDLAVSVSGDRIRYAKALASMEEIRAGCSELAVAATGGSLFSRIHRLVGKESSDSSRAGWIPFVITILLIAIIAVPTTIALTTKSKPQESEQKTEQITDASAGDDKGSIEGKIIDIDTGKGISGVQLVAVPNPSPESHNRFSCTSGKDGTFTISGLKSGEYLLQGDFPSVDVGVVSGKSTNNVFIGIRREQTVLPQKETPGQQQSSGQILIGSRMIQMPADAMKEVFGPNENFSSGLLFRQGHEIAGRLLTLTKERKDTKLLEPSQIMLLNNNDYGTISVIKEEFFIHHYEPNETEPGKLDPQLQPIDVGWKFKIFAKIPGDGEQVHIKLSASQQKSDFETLQYRPGYDYQIPSPPEIFAADFIAKNGEPVVIGRLIHDETAYCLIVTPSAILPEQQPEPLLGKKLPEPDNIQNIDSLRQAEGKRILVCFWDMNQRPSRNLVGELAKREKDLTDKNVAVLLVDTSGIEPAKLKEWLDNHNIPFTCGSVKNNAKNVLTHWGVRAQPWLNLTDKNRVVQAEGFSLDRLDEKLQAEESDEAVAAGSFAGHELGANYVEGALEFDIPIILPLKSGKEQNPAISNYPWIEFTKINDQLYATIDIKYASWPETEWKIKVGLLDGDTTSSKARILKQVETTFKNTGTIETLAHIEEQQIHIKLGKWNDMLEASSFRFSIEAVWSRQSNPVRFNERIPLELQLCSPGYSSFIEAEWIKIESVDDKAYATCHVNFLSGPKTKWRLLVKLFDEDSKITKEIAKGDIKFENNGVIRGLPFRMHQDLDIQLGEWSVLSKASRYEVRLEKVEQDEKTFVQSETEGAEESTSNKSSAPLLSKSDVPSAEDKSIVRIDLSMVEVPPGSQVDRETATEIRNILGGKITIPDSPAAADLLRKASKATEPVEGEPAGDKRVTQKEFKTLFDLLVSRGYAKILMNPTLQAFEGQTAQIKTDQSSLEVTVESVKDEHISMQVKADLSSQISVGGEGKIPMISRRSLSNFVSISSGQSLILDGMGSMPAHSDDEGNAEGSRAPAEELMCIVTANIIAPSADEVQQNNQITISGQCHDSRGRPLTNAQVLFFCRDAGLGSLIQIAKNETDSDGRFTLGPIKRPGEEDWGQKSYFVFMPAEGHGPAWKRVDLYKPNEEPLELTAYDPAIVTGNILTEDSKPVAGAKVWVRGIISPEATEDPASRINDLYINSALPGWSAVTKQDGSFRIPGVPDVATIQLFISHTDFAGSIVHVKPGFDAKIKLQPAATVAGRVLYGKTGKPAAGVIIQAQAVEHIRIPGGYSMSWTQTITDEQGRYKLESLYENKYNIWAKAENLTVVALDSFQAVAGETIEAPDLVLIEGGFITGRVIEEATGKPIRPGQHSDVGIYGPSRPKSGAAIESSDIKEDGSFIIRVAPGRNYIYLRAMGEWGRDKAIASPAGRWVNVAGGQTIEVEFKVRKLTQKELEVQAKRRQKETIKYILPKTIDEVEQQDKDVKKPPAGKPVIRVYDISDLVIAGARASRGTFDVTMDRSDAIGASHVNIPDEAIVNEARNIVNLIMRTIDPNSWFENNENAIGIITPYPVERPRKLAVYQTLHAHQQIKKFLESRREQSYKTQISIELRYLYTNMEFLNEVRDSMNIEFTPDTFLDDKQLATLFRSSQKNKDIKSLMATGATVFNNETARFSIAGHIFTSFLGYPESNNLSQQSPPVQIRITPHIENNKNILIDFVQDIPGLHERIIHDRRGMMQSYTETIAITNKRIPENKTLAFACDVIKFDRDKQTASPAEKKILIVLIKPAIIVQEERPASEAPAMILHSPRLIGDTAGQPDDTILPKPVTKEQHITDKDKIQIDTKILTASDEFMKYIGLDPNSVASSEGWSEYLVHSTDDLASFIINQLLASFIIKSSTTQKDVQMLHPPGMLAKSGMKYEMYI